MAREKTKCVQFVCCVRVQGCLFITCCVMTSATHHLPFLKRVIDQPVFQHVNKIIPTLSTSCLSISAAMTSSALNRSRGAIGLILCVCVFDLTVMQVPTLKWRHTPFKNMPSFPLYEVTKCTVATRHEGYSNCNCGKRCQPPESRVRVKEATSYSIFIPRHVPFSLSHIYGDVMV